MVLTRRLNFCHLSQIAGRLVRKRDVYSEGRCHAFLRSKLAVNRLYLEPRDLALEENLKMKAVRGKATEDQV
ncbi:unnamed protein product [Caenorhabditis auriculariae]|uniref:Uncharacterized protein n=1 Tax=Caenorhabditis auriculariae TaxID=2777116 RepID=A0A8S1H4H4_9PELO|nr:unnamed protein product [Caenorhabditis auriculariae]